MSQVDKRREGGGKQRDLIIDIEQQINSAGGRKKSSSTSNSGKQHKAATKSSESCKVLDTHALIDAVDVATGEELGRTQTRATPSQLQSQSKQQVGTKLDDEFDKTNYPSLDELNNNSIPPGRVSQVFSATAQPTTTTSTSKATATTTTTTTTTTLTKQHHSSSLVQTAQPVETPLSLLTGLRMHTSNLRAQKLDQQSNRPTTTNIAQDRRKLLIKNDDQTLTTQPRVPHSTATSSSPTSYVESSLNPPEQGAPTDYVTRKSNTPPNITSYTSIFSQKPSVTSSPSPDRQRAQLAKLSSPTSVSSYSQHQHLLSETIQTNTTNRNNQSNSRSPLIKQTVQSPELSSRSLFATSSRQIDTQKRLPSIFDQSSGRHKNPSDYDESTTNRPRLSQQRHFEANDDDDDDDDDIVNYENEDDDEREGEEVDEEDDEVYQERNLDDHSESSVISSTRKGGHLLNNLRHNSDSKNQAISKRSNSSPESQHRNHQQQHLDRQIVKYPGSSSKLNSSNRRRGHSPARRNDTLRLIMGSQQQHKKSSQPQQSQSHTRISFNEMSRPPSFNTTTTATHQQELDMKAASCRRLDLLEQAAHLECSCHICAKNRKLGSLHDNLYYHLSHQQLGNLSGGSTSKLTNFNLNKSGLGSDRTYPKTRFLHMVLKSIILILCTLLLLLILVGAILISHYLPQSMDKVVNASRSFNVTIAGRR